MDADMATTVRVFEIPLYNQSTRMARKFAERVLTEVEDEAKLNAAGGIYSKGRLAKSVYKSGPLVLGRTIHGSVGSRLSYASIVEKGARVHNIFPKGAPHIYRFGRKRRPMLKFIWRGHMVYMNQIPGGPGTIGRSHPGQRGKHWLSRALISVAHRHNVRVIVYEL